MEDAQPPDSLKHRSNDDIFRNKTVINSKKSPNEKIIVEPSFCIFVPDSLDIQTISLRSHPLLDSFSEKLNTNWQGEAAIVFGDFWEDPEKGPCLRLKTEAEAKHALVYATWSKYSYGKFSTKKVKGLRWFSQETSYGNHRGKDLWVFDLKSI